VNERRKEIKRKKGAIIRWTEEKCEENEHSLVG
jgi:hypothetical protein